MADRGQLLAHGLLGAGAVRGAVLGAIALWMREPPPPAAAPRESLHESLRTFGALFRCRTPWASSRWRW
jgi:hypothetical protein